MNAQTIPTVAIIGGGFSGTMVAVHLLQRAQLPLRILLIERHDQLGRGIAYRDQPECHLLNVRAEGMSAFPGQPDHFFDWLNTVHSPDHPVDRSEYVPRRLYGVYVQSLLAMAQSNAHPDATFEAVSDEVVGLKLTESGIGLGLARERGLTANYVVLALGNPGPSDPPLMDFDVLGSPRYIGQAWSRSGPYSLDRDENLLLIGSGLTAIDWLAGLRSHGHRGRITVLSRRGLLPQPHQPTPPHTLGFDPMALPARLRPLVRQLCTEVAGLDTAGGDWRGVVDALRPFTQRLWQRLPVIERQRFLRHLRPYWEVHRHRAAPGLAESVRNMQLTGQLQLIAGRLLKLEECSDHVTAKYRARINNEVARLDVQRVINCTGPENNYRRLNHPLLAALRDQGLMQSDAIGLGLKTDEHGALIDAEGAISAQLFTLGPPRKGQLWETTAVPEIRVQAQLLAQLLISAITAMNIVEA